MIQVLSNLIDNALRFTPRKGRVTVHVEQRDSDIRFSVEDTGRGISPEMLPHLFDRFWRLHGRRDGAGLGLFIAKGIVTAWIITIPASATVAALFYWLSGFFG